MAHENCTEAHCASDLENLEALLGPFVHSLTMMKTLLKLLKDVTVLSLTPLLRAEREQRGTGHEYNHVGALQEQSNWFQPDKEKYKSDSC